MIAPAHLRQNGIACASSLAIAACMLTPNAWSQTVPAPTSATAPLMPGAANSEPLPIRAIRLNPGESIAMDGSLSSPAWQRAPIFSEFVENQPNRGAKPRHETRVQVVYDDKALYFGITALDPNPNELRAMPVRHDQVFRIQDFIVVYVDAMGLRKSAQFFRTNALGVTADGLHTADNDGEDFSPDFDHDVAARRTPQGYTAVIRVPYSALRFDPANPRPWRVMVGRRLPREQTILNLSVPLRREDPSFISKLQVLEGFTPPAAQTFWQLRPTLTARRTQDTNGAISRSESDAKVSLDAKLQPNPQWVLDATLNPDFSQVALDVPQLSRNNRFALFQQEKRPVFLESRDLINTLSDSIYTRAVHDPRWVARASYRGTSASGTVIATADKGGGLTLLPGTYGSGAAVSPANRTVLTRWRSDGVGHTYGIVASSRQYRSAAGMSLGHNQHAGVDWQHELPWSLAGGGWRTVGQVSASDTSARPNAAGQLTEQTSQSGHRVWTQLARRGSDWDAEINFDQRSPHYRNDAGFVTQTGVAEISGEVKRKLHQVNILGKTFNDVHAYIVGRQIRDTQNHGPTRGDTITGYLTPGVWFQGDRSEFSTELRALSLVRSGPAAPLMREHNMHFWGSTQPGGKLPYIEGSMQVGKLADYASDRTRQGLRWNVFARTRIHPRLELEPKLEQLRFSSAAGGGALTETAGQVLGIYHLKPRHSLRLILQASRFERQAQPALGLVSENGHSGTQSLTYIWRQNNAQALYVGASHGKSTGASAGTAFPRNKGSEAFVKYQFEL